MQISDRVSNICQRVDKMVRAAVRGKVCPVQELDIWIRVQKTDLTVLTDGGDGEGLEHG